MSNKKVTEALTGYLGELFNEPEPSIEPDTSIAADNKSTHSESQQATAPALPDTSIEQKSLLVKPELTTFKPTIPKPRTPEPQISELIKPEPTTSKPAVSQPLADKQVEEEPVPLQSTVTADSSYEQHKKRLEKMLQQVTLEQHAVPQVDTATSFENATQTKAKTDITIEEKTKSKTETDAEFQQRLRQSMETGVVVEQETESYQPLIISSEWLDNGRPNWAQDRFDILLIEVNGLQLAVPLVALGQIQALDDNLTPLFGQSDWFMGLQKTPSGNVKTVNTAKFVMPERYQDEHNYQFVVSINGLPWGLAVDSIHQPISIEPDDIRWRSKRENRPWMAGTVKDHMCVLLDIPSMGDILQNQDKNNPESLGKDT